MRRFPEAGVPSLGVCLGHQSLAQAFGGTVVQHEPVHGKTTTIEHDGRTIFAGLPSPLDVGRYHSLVVDPDLPDSLERTAFGGDVVMGVRHRELPAEGVQFHPESVLTEEGKALLRELPGRGRFDLNAEPHPHPRARRASPPARTSPPTRPPTCCARSCPATPPRWRSPGFLSACAPRARRSTSSPAWRATMRELATRVAVPDRDDLLDTAGTGGGRPSFNVSTTAALIAAGAGCRVAKHGNRSATSAVGLGRRARGARRAHRPRPRRGGRVHRASVGFGFMFAPAHHAATRFVVPVRRELAVRTIFNFLGPAHQPGRRHAPARSACPTRPPRVMAGALARLGPRRALVVSSEDGLDEMSTSAPTHVVEVDGRARSALRRRSRGRRASSAPQLARRSAGTPEENAAYHARDPRRREAGPRGTSPCSTPAPRSTRPAAPTPSARRRPPAPRGRSTPATPPRRSTRFVQATHDPRRRARRERPRAHRRVHARRRRAPAPRGPPRRPRGRRLERRDDRPFSEALVRPGISLIAEHKRRSPSAGVDPRGPGRRRRRLRLRARRRRRALGAHRGPPLRRLARRPARGQAGHATCPSCARTSSSTPTRSYESAAAGADAILLIVAALEPATTSRACTARRARSTSTCSSRSTTSTSSSARSRRRRRHRHQQPRPHRLLRRHRAHLRAALRRADGQDRGLRVGLPRRASSSTISSGSASTRCWWARRSCAPPTSRRPAASSTADAGGPLAARF